MEKRAVSSRVAALEKKRTAEEAKKAAKLANQALLIQDKPKLKAAGGGGGGGRAAGAGSSKKIAWKSPDVLPYGCSTLSNTCFATRPLPVSINIRSLERAVIPEEWSSKAGANKAARHEEYYGRLMGFVAINVPKVSEDELQALMALNNVYDSEIFSEEGEFKTARGQIPVSRLLDLIPDHEVLNAVYALQNPISSPWKVPLIRVVSNHEYDPNKKSLKVQLWLYFSRLIFELIADPAIKTCMDNLQGIPYRVIKATPRKQQPLMFQSTGLEIFEQESYRFSLAGLLKHAENSGYTMVEQQPEDLIPELYGFQKSTLQWMLDQENAPLGLNGAFWDKWETADGGGPMYYFPIAGEFRLATPPVTTGGLLSEEMGMGICVKSFIFVFRPLHILFLTHFIQPFFINLFAHKQALAKRSSSSP